jgi:hypothetical protein
MAFGRARLDAVDGVDAHAQTEKIFEIPRHRVLGNAQLNHLINNESTQIAAASALP